MFVGVRVTSMMRLSSSQALRTSIRPWSTDVFFSAPGNLPRSYDKLEAGGEQSLAALNAKAKWT
jgi:hypothetical protein